MRLKIIRMKQLDSGSCRAFCDVLLEDIGFAINGVRIIEGSGGSLFAGFPSERYEKDGEVRYRNHVAIPERELYDAFQREMIAAYKNYNPQEIPSRKEFKQEDSIIEDDGLPF